MWHRDVSASSVYHRSTHRRGRDPVCLVRRAPNARRGDEPARDGSRERQHIHRRRPDDSPRRTASHPRVTRETDPRTAPSHQHRSDARADSPSPRDLRAHAVSPDDARRREADAETAARREWDAYWEDLHRRSRIGLLRSGNLSGTAARRRFGPPLTLGEWGEDTRGGMCGRRSCWERARARTSARPTRSPRPHRRARRLFFRRRRERRRWFFPPQTTTTTERSSPRCRRRETRRVSPDVAAHSVCVVRV